MSTTLTRDLPERLLSLRYSTIDEGERSISAVLATENPTAVFDFREGAIDEVLLTSGAVLPRYAPMLDSHDRSSISKVLGSVRLMEVQNGEVVGRLFFAAGDAESEKAWSLVQQGHLTDVSVGYRIIESELIYARSEKVILGRQFRASGRPLRVVTKWELKELSLVPIGADPAATVQRSFPTRNQFSQGDFQMHSYSNSQPFRQALAGALMLRGGLNVNNRLANEADRYRNFSLPDLCKEALRGERIEPEEDYRSAVRQAVSNSAVSEIFSTAVNAAVLQGFANVEDPTAGWCKEADVKNYLPQERAVLQGTSQLEPVPRGGTARHAQLDLSQVETYSVRRFGKQFTISEEDMLDDNFGALIQVPQALGAAARQLRPGLVFSIIQENANLADGLPLFHADRNNDFTHVLGSPGIKYISAAMGTQFQDTGDGGRIPFNVRGRYLIVPEALRFTAAELVRSLEVAEGNTNLVVRSDGRIDLGARNPETKVAHAGSTTAWFLASADRPAIEVGYLLQGRQPAVRQYTLDNGEWGIGFDIKYDVGAKAVDPKGIFRGNS